MPKTSPRIKQFTESFIREMTRIASQYNAINLAQGFPGFDLPPALVDAAMQALGGDHHQYAITWGPQGFRNTLARKQTYFMGLEIDPNAHTTVIDGSTEAMITATMSVCDLGEN